MTTEQLASHCSIITVLYLDDFDVYSKKIEKSELNEMKRVLKGGDLGHEISVYVCNINTCFSMVTL